MPDATDGLKALRRREAIMLLASAQDKLDTSRSRVAASIVRLANADRLCGPAPAQELDAAPELALLDALARPCDLDLLLFFGRHPRAILTLDDLVSRVGYDIDQMAVALDVLQGAGLLTWSKRGPEDAAGQPRLYLLTPGTWGGLLPAFLWVAVTPEGRWALRRALETMPARGNARGARDTDGSVLGATADSPPWRSPRKGTA